MILGGEESVDVEMVGIEFEQVKSFKYLGVKIQNNGKQEAETFKGWNQLQKRTK